MIFRYARKRMAEQIRSVWLIIVYLVLFQTIVLGIPVAGALVISAGLFLVIAGLAFFMEGLFLGLMPMGETIGIKLPQKSVTPVILIFSFILGIGVTFAEPAIGVLKIAGSSVKAWDAPLLFLLLNKFTGYLVWSIGIGVGLAVLFGMLRFLHNWSLKPFIYALVTILLGITVWGLFIPNIRHLTGLAWDCGGVTTGPVTVPLVLALGIGITRIVSKGNSAAGGFGVVTLASAFPVITVLLLGIFFLDKVPEPMEKEAFFSYENSEKAVFLFESKELYDEYSKRDFNQPADKIKTDTLEILKRNSFSAFQAIVPLTIFLFIVLTLVLREKFKKFDEILLGVVFALAGMSIFNIGIELGLSKLGGQVGEKLPSSFTAIELSDRTKVIDGFDLSLVQTAVTEKGTQEKFFYSASDGKFEAIPFNRKNFDPSTGRYVHIPKKGPLFGTEWGFPGILVVLIFAFIMGYGATLAEPALNALGQKVEELSVGTFKKSLLMQAVAVGVGLGIALGLVKIIWNVPLAYLLVPPYLILLFVTAVSDEDFVNIGWDSAGVTTGPITVPLVLAMGLGIQGQVGGAEGFGILAMASVMPILCVLLMGLYMKRKHKKAVEESKKDEMQTGAAV
jgi:hypothetical protein